MAMTIFDRLDHLVEDVLYLELGQLGYKLLQHTSNVRRHELIDKNQVIGVFIEALNFQNVCVIKLLHHLSLEVRSLQPWQRHALLFKDL